MSSEALLSNIVPFAGSGVAGFFMGMFLRRMLKFLVIIIGSFLDAVFLVVQWMQARQYVQGQVDWTRVGNDMYGCNHFLLKFEPSAIGVNIVSNIIYVANQLDNTVSVIDGEIYKVVAKLDIMGLYRTS